MQITSRTLELKGTNYEIGRALGQMIAAVPPLKAFYSSGKLDGQDLAQAAALFSRWCPGLNDEIQGFADALCIAPGQVIYCAMTYLIPRCSQMVLLPPITQNGHMLMARNYEFSHTCEDFTLKRTCVNGKYTHMGTSVLLFGREEGLNEHGFGVTMSSCGFPVGAPENMRNPAIRGLQYWAVMRTLLENCKDVTEALLYLKEMPIAYNINLLLADRSGDAALVETVDGHMAYKQAERGEPFLCATNHVVLGELKHLEPAVMRNSTTRYNAIQRFIKEHSVINADDIKALQLRAYPDGLCCHDYNGFFGTTKSIVMDLNDGTLEICWGGLADNGWQCYDVAKTLEACERPIRIHQEGLAPDFYEFIDSQE